MNALEIVLLIVVVLVVAAAAWFGVAAVQRNQLRRRFGPEYDRLLAQHGDRAAAERELRDRERQHATLELRPLDEPARARYSTAWQELQTTFIDSPETAVGEADRLVTELMAERGYPTGDHDTQAAELSVEHGRTIGHYRDAHELHLRNERGEASTEDLRQALVHYRALVADLLGQDPVRNA